MKQAFEIHKVSQMHEMGDLGRPKHPLVSVIYNRDLKSAEGLEGLKIVNHLYTVIFKSSNVCSSISYGRNVYDHEEGTMVFTAPGQVMEFTNDEEGNQEIDPDGWTLVFHPDVFRSSELASRMSKYSFFHYDSNEALHISEEELQSIEDLLQKIVSEYSQKLDQHSQHLIVSNIELFLDYCLRFYDRQFYARAHLNSDTISKFERYLREYFDSEEMLKSGVPSVELCAREMHLSPNYLSDLLKRETGKTTLEHIHLKLIDRAKNRLLNSTESVSGIAYSLGFDYPQRFSNLFKAKTGFSPSEFRELN